ncbi:MAG: hypothetical protein LBN74_09610 [Prevotella sp.]|jgi:hypothetical protein|nr:hypothetical protein [Prevotella sp.]
MKTKTITLALTFLFVLFTPIGVSAQGIYSDDDLAIVPSDGDNYNYDAPLRDGELDPPTGLDPKPDPIGEGLLILSALAGGYALVKKRSSKKESTL